MKNLFKTTLLLVSFCLISNMAFAQKKSFVSVDLGYLKADAGFVGVDEISSFNIGPSYGYWLNDRSAIVAGLNFSSQKVDDLKASSFGVAAEFRYGWNINDNVFLYLAPGVAFGSTTQEVTSTTEAKFTTLDIGISPGVQFKLADSWSINTKFGNLGYSSLKPKDGDGISSFGLDLTMSSVLFGLQYHF